MSLTFDPDPAAELAVARFARKVNDVGEMFRQLDGPADHDDDPPSDVVPWTLVAVVAGAAGAAGALLTLLVALIALGVMS